MRSNTKVYYNGFSSKELSQCSVALSHFVIKLLHFVIKLLHFVIKLLHFVIKLLHCVIPVSVCRTNYQGRTYLWPGGLVKRLTISSKHAVQRTFESLL